jgi:hypothetical protein
MTVYQIRLEGHLSDLWTDWFGGVTITLETDGSTVLTCQVIDQAALHGLLKKVRDLGMLLISVNQIRSGQENRSDLDADMDHDRSNKETKA